MPIYQSTDSANFTLFFPNVHDAARMASIFNLPSSRPTSMPCAMCKSMRVVGAGVGNESAVIVKITAELLVRVRLALVLLSTASLSLPLNLPSDSTAAEYIARPLSSLTLHPRNNDGAPRGLKTLKYVQAHTIQVLTSAGYSSHSRRLR